MVALFQPAPFQNGTPCPAPSHPPRLRLVVGGQSARSSSTIARSAVGDPRLLIALGLVLLAVVVISLRLVQGAPTADTWVGLQAESAANAQPAAESAASSQDRLLVAKAGDTWWGIALAAAPGQETTEVVRLLTAANGGSALAEGQVVRIPASLG